MGDSLDLSVLIATRDRCDKLEATLGRLEAIGVPAGLRWEVVVVDNGSTDATRAVCAAFVDRDPGRFVYAHEARRGKSVALNTGLRIARGAIVAFTDDDCLVDPGWLRAMLAEYAADAELSVLGGRVELADRRDVALTLVAVERKTPFTSARMLYPDPPIIGCNMAFRRRVLERVGDFDVRMGPGTPAIAEDVDIVYRAFKGGFKVATCPSVVVYHDHGRRDDGEIRALLHRYYVGRGAFYCKHILTGDGAVARMAAGDLWSTFLRICRLRGVRGELRFLAALGTGALTRFRRPEAG